MSREQREATSKGILLLGIWTMLLQMVTSYTFTIFPDDPTGGSSTPYNILIISSVSSGEYLNTTISSMTITFPSAYTLGGGYTCSYQGSSTTCSYSGSNTVSVNMLIPNNSISTATVRISSILNPAVEIGSVPFTVQFVRSCIHLSRKLLTAQRC